MAFLSKAQWVTVAVVGGALFGCSQSAEDAATDDERVAADETDPEATSPTSSPVSGSAEPSEPTLDSDEPAAEPDGTEPAGPAEPGDREPIEPAEPNSNPGEPAEPAEPGPNPGGPAEPGEPVAVPTEPSEPAGPAEPAEPNEPVPPSEPTDPSDGPEGGNAGAPAVEALSFAYVQEAIFEPAGCMAGYCHGGSAGDLTWSYEELVGVEAAEPVCGLSVRVVPGDPEASVLWARVRPEPEGVEPCAEKMPMAGPPLTTEQADLVYDWILTGAAP